MAEASQYAVVFGLDRLPTDSDIDELIHSACLGVAKKALTVHVNVGNLRDVLAQATAATYPRQFLSAAKEEWAAKGFSVSESGMVIGHRVLSDGSVFVIVTV